MIKEFSLEQIENVARQVVNSCRHKIILLNGNLGAGKTTLVNHIAHHLGCSSSVSSPTFGIVNELDLDGEPAYHIDLYRIEHLEELAQLGFDEYVSSGNYCFIEWPEVGMPYIPEEHHVITLEQVNENTRKISFI